MAITAFSEVGNGLVIGCTYWNHWIFMLDTRSHQVESIGPVPGWGEFVCAARFNGVVAIPHYQGDFVVYDPNRPYRACPKTPGQQILLIEADDDECHKTANPRVVERIAGAHFALDCTVSPSGTLYYATVPNYHQPGGMLIIRRPDGTRRVIETVGQNLTFKRLAFCDGYLYGGTIDVQGQGLPQRQKRRPTSLVRMAADGTLLEIQQLPGRTTASVQGLIPVGPSVLLAGTHDGQLYLVNAETDRMQIENITDQLTAPLKGGIKRMTEHAPGTVLVLTTTGLYRLQLHERSVSLVSRFDESAQFLARGASGHVYVATREAIYFLDRRLLE